MARTIDQIAADLIASKLTPRQLELLVELIASTPSRVDAAAERRREWDREYRKTRRKGGGKQTMSARETSTRLSTGHNGNHCDLLSSLTTESVSEEGIQEKKEPKTELVEGENKSKRGTRLRPDAKLSDSGRQYALAHGANPDKLWAEFVDFWISVPGSRGLKLNWESTWRNRVRTVSGQTGAPDVRDRKSVIAAADRLIASGFKIGPKPTGIPFAEREANLRLLPKG